MLTSMRKKENIRYEVRHPGFGFPWSPLLLPFLFLLLMFVIHPVIINLSHGSLASVQRIPKPYYCCCTR